MPLSSKQLEHFGKRLREERARAVQLINGLNDPSGETLQDEAGDLSMMPSHPADLGTDTIDAEVDASNATRASRELQEIDDALERLYKTPEQFGRCEETGREIPYERLDIIPWARTCGDGPSS
ncbi:MAG: TraR/DksA C4-type zinc finger protein [bacterium]